MHPREISIAQYAAQTRMLEALRPLADLAGVDIPQRGGGRAIHDPAICDLIRYEQQCGGIEALARLVLQVMTPEKGTQKNVS